MKSIDRIILILKMVCCALFVIIIGVTFAQVVARYLYGKAFFWGEELAIYSMVWLTFLGSVVVTNEGAHTRITFFVELLPKPAQKYVRCFANLLCIGFLVGLASTCAGTVEVAMRSYSAGLRVPMGVLYVAVPVSGILMIVYFLLHIYKELRGQSMDSGEGGETV